MFQPVDLTYARVVLVRFGYFSTVEFVQTCLGHACYLRPRAERGGSRTHVSDLSRSLMSLRG